MERDRWSNLLHLSFLKNDVKSYILFIWIPLTMYFWWSEIVISGMSHLDQYEFFYERVIPFACLPYFFTGLKGNWKHLIIVSCLYLSLCWLIIPNTHGHDIIGYWLTFPDIMQVHDYRHHVTKLEFPLHNYPFFFIGAFLAGWAVRFFKKQFIDL